MMLLSLPLLLGFGALLGLWFTWLVWRRPNRQRLVWRLLASWGVVTCLVFLLVPPSITKTYLASEAILLTQGYSPDSLQALQKRLQPRPQVYCYAVEADKAKVISDFTAFQKQHPAVKTLHVLGHGLSAEDLEALEPLRLVPHLTPLPAGVLAASWPQRITLGDELQVQGTFHPTKERGATLRLQSAGHVQDSVEIKKGADQPFRLGHKPKATGRFVYELSWKGENDSVYQEFLPVEVVPSRPLNVLLLGASPSFESRFLKNLLASQGHGVAVRQQVSKGIFRTEMVNLPTLRLDRLTPSLLQRFDVVLLDEATLKGTTVAERRVLQQAVQLQGLSVLTSFTSGVPASIPFFSEKVLKPVSPKQSKNEALRWASQPSGKAVLPLPGVQLQPKEGQVNLVWAQNPEQAVVLKYRKGMGQVGVSLVAETFPLALEGKEDLYQHYWASLLIALAKPEVEAALTVEPDPTAAQVNHPFTLAIASDSSVKELKFEKEPNSSASSPLAIHPSSEFSTSYFGTGWPKETGWHSITLPGGKAHSVYVFPETAWQVKQLAQKHRLLVSRSEKADNSQPPESQQVEELFPLWPFGLGLVLMLGFLWLEEKW